MNCAGRYCSLPGSRLCAEKEGGKQITTYLCDYLRSYRALFLRRARTEQVPHVLIASTALRSHAACDAHVAQRSFTLFSKKAFSQTWFSESTFLQGVLTRKKAVANTNHPQPVLTATETFHVFHGVGYVKGCLKDRLAHTKLHRKTRI